MNAKLKECALALLFSAAATLAGAEPVASAWSSLAPASDSISAIVAALNAEASLKDAKITVQPDGNNVLLTGVAQTREQVQRASEIAAAGGAMVVNVMRSAKTTYDAPNYDLQAGTGAPRT
jgi:hypothetical protein